MNRRTFEIISKYISSQNGAKIAFDQEGDGASTDMKTGVIHMPAEVGEKNVFAILALLMHESAHIKYSKEALEKCVTPGDGTGMHIFNCIEDIRIDNKNFTKLANVKSFYDRLMKDHCDYSKNKDENINFQIKLLITAMMNIQGFSKYGFKIDPAVGEFLQDNKLEDLISEGTKRINYGDWNRVKQIIQEIKDMLKMAEQKHQQQQQQGQGQSGKPTQGSQPQGQQPSSGQSADPLAGIEKIVHPDSIFSDTGTSLQGASASQVGEVALEEKTIQQFKELLNITEKKIVEDGTVLDTDNLIAFFTGELEELFKDDAYIKCKKSKILFLLDSSGSMGDRMLDGKPRYRIVAKCVERMTRILKEVQDHEGVNVDWDIAKFESSGMEMLSKNDWQRYYHAGGGTALSYAFTEAIDHLEKDFAVDGKKMIIVLTDGDVSNGQIEDMKKDIVHHNTNVKALVIGVGTDPAGPMAIKILGDNLILAEEHANEVLLETIRRLL